MKCLANVTNSQNTSKYEGSFFVKVAFTMESRGGKYEPIDRAPVFTTGGKPSTWFPPGGLVEQSPEREAPKRTNRRATHKQANKQASEQASKPTNTLASKRASKKTTSKQTNERTKAN